ncbi:MAG: MBL fold metallo-hydrolase [Acidobacteria bacterium]|nr:MBL fold metallo-hydrolase [Acidobacteriota bacterium]
MKEDELGELGIFRIPVPIPFREAGGPVNAYIIEEKNGCLMFDAGLGTEDSRAALSEGLARTGHRFEDVNRILLSHGHIDHFGAAAWIQEQAGRQIPISIHPADAGKVLQSGLEWPKLLMQNRRYFSMLGVPAAMIEETAAVLGNSAELGKRLEKVTPLLPGQILQCRHVTLEILHMPGHTPGVCCLYDRDNRLLFSADHFLQNVSPNPLLELSPNGEPPSFKPLLSYFASIDRVRSLSVDLVLPGHAAPFSRHREVIDSLSSFYERRQAKILDSLKHGPLTVYEIMKELFTSERGFELILMISETLGNLEVLEEKGRIRREMDSGCARFMLVE